MALIEGGGPSTRIGESLRSSLARKYTIFTALLLGWVSFIFFAYDLRRDNISLSRIALLGLTVILVAGAISKYTNHLLARPLIQLQKGISGVIVGRLEPIRVSPTGDEIQYLGESLNAMIEALNQSRQEVSEHRQLLEQRIRQRTEALEEATQKALSVSRAKSEFLANISHELRTPMSGILGMVDIVLDDELTPEQRENLETAKMCANTLLALLNDILDLSKIEAGKMVLERIPYDIRALAQDCVRSMVPRCRQKGIEISARVDPGVPPRLLGDPLRIRQILTNLLSNAVKFTEKGSVELRVAAEGATASHLRLRIEVADTGAGIPPGKQAAIFEEFTQADGSVSRKYGGTGLGLAITRRLVQMHSGSISVDSAVGHGSTFIVELYTEVAAQAALAPPDESLARGTGNPDAPPRPARILIAEDNLVNQKVVSAILKKNGYEVHVAGNGREALACLERCDYDLVLMDVQMPELDGIRTARRIRENMRWKDLPVVAMTAHAMIGDQDRCLRAGMNGYLSKPVTPAHLLDIVSRHLRAANPHSRKQRGAIEELPAPIDGALARRLMDDDSRLMSGMALLFVQLAPERIRKMQAAAVRMDQEALRGQAEKLEKAAERIAAVSVAACARQIAGSPPDQDYAVTQGQLLNLEREITRLDRHIRSGAGYSREAADPEAAAGIKTALQSG
jgi:signal transduction histidine kinase/DNA-binding NarL/FixJ family response regulator